MTDPTTRLALTTLIAAAISSCEREIGEMNRAACMVEKAERRRIEATYQAASNGAAWRQMIPPAWSRR